MRGQRPTIAVSGHRLVVQITDDGSRTLVDPDTGVAYHSASGAIAESTHVYVGNSGVAARLAEGRPTSVLEIGLGTGMTLLLTVDAAMTAGTALHYVAVENDWLDAELLHHIKIDKHLRHPPLAKRFLRWRESQQALSPTGVYPWNLGTGVQLTVYHHEARQWAAQSQETFDAVYFDPFAPDENAELWEPAFLEHMHRMLNDGGRLVTYCVNRKVRHDMAAVGFDVQRVCGPAGGKREVMIATKAAS